MSKVFGETLILHLWCSINIVTNVGICIEPTNPKIVAQIAIIRGGKNVPIKPVISPAAQAISDSTAKINIATEPFPKTVDIHGPDANPARPLTFILSQGG